MARIAVLFLTTLICACSSKFAYRYADWMVEREIFKYLDIDRKQRKNLKAQIDLLHQWHQYQELPKYLDLLNQLQAIIEQEQAVSPQQLQALENAAIPRWFSIVDKASTTFIPVLANLDKEQREHLRQQVENDNKAFMDEYEDLNEQERRQRAIKNMRNNSKDFLGKLSPEQKQRIETWGQDLSLGAEIYQADRLAWQKKFFALMEENTKPGFATQMKDLLLYQREDWTPQRQQHEKHSQKLRNQLFADLLNLASNKQKKKLLGKIADYQELCRDLSAEASD